MKGRELRRAYLDYFKSKGHQEVASSSLVPERDPTLLFINAGMNQFKDLFLGAEKRSYCRATTSQKCMRISGKHNDLENVGVTARHHTFFEMLGNFSFGDYFKPDAIKFAWEFVTEVLMLDKSKLWVTIFEKDDQAEELWVTLTDVPKNRVLRLGEKDNFWAMGDTGPCGPCSEIHYYMGTNPAEQCAEHFLKDDGSYMEIWNLVFMQFNRSADGSMTPLPKPSVDTGMGLERVAAIMQGVQANYDCDLLRDIISTVEQLSGFKYDGSSYVVRNLRTDLAYARDVAMRVIADHSRALAFLIADGVQPSSDGRGYVLRRVLRRAVRHGQVLGFKEPFLEKTIDTVIAGMGDDYPELNEQRDTIVRVVTAEERKFRETLDAGLAILQRQVEKLGSTDLFPGDVAFLLHDTYGFPLDLTEDALKAYGCKVDVPRFEAAMQEQRDRSREDRRSQEAAFVSIKVDSPKTEFLGYQTLRCEGRLTQVVGADSNAELRAGQEVGLFFDATPFYAESGGQVADTGEVRFKGGVLAVTDVQKVQNDYFLHKCRVQSGIFSSKLVGETAELAVDEDRRNRIRCNHTATHLVHAGLRRVLGSHAKQAGSRVDQRSLRFDYAHFEPLTAKQISELQLWVNQQVRANFEVCAREMTMDEAKQAGAIALFGEKYGERVRVLQVGDISMELCGGTHVSRSGDIGLVLLAGEGGISAGVRRIECLSGAGAFEAVIAERADRARIAEILKGDSQDLPARVEKLSAHARDLEKELERLKGKLAQAAGEELISNTRRSAGGVKVLTEIAEGADTATLRAMVDRLRLKLGSGVVAIGSVQDGSAVIVVGVTPDLTKSISAGNLVKEAAKLGGGKGGGRPDFAQAGGVNPSLLRQSLEKVFEAVG